MPAQRVRPFIRSTLIFAFATLALTAFVPSCVLSQTHRTRSDEDLNAIGQRDLGKGMNFYSLDREKELGKALAQEVERASHLQDDAFATDYLNRLAQNLAKNSDAKLPITVRVIDSDVVDAFTLPGGYQYVTRGLILSLDSEAELAGVLAHGIAHTAMRDETRLAIKGEIMQLAAIPAMISMPSTLTSRSTLQSLNLAIPLTFLQFSRDAERAADFYGLQYLYKAGYKAESYPQLLERLLPKATPSKKTPDAFSPFPPLPERLKAIREEIARLMPPRENETLSSTEFDTVKERLRVWKTPVPDPQNSQKPTLRRLAERPEQILD